MFRHPWIAALTVLIVLVTSSTAAAAPKPTPKPSKTTAAKAADKDITEGGTPELTEKLEETTRAFIDAQNALAASQARRETLAARRDVLETRYSRLNAETQTISVTAYQNGGGMRSAATLLSSGTPGVFADRVSTLEVIARNNAEQLKKLAAVRADLVRTKATIDAEVAEQQAQLAVMAAQKAEVERALVEARRALDAATTWSSRTPLVEAAPAPRRADGSWPVEECKVADPTTSGCLTPRTVHALAETHKAGFTRYVSCWRAPGQPYEHPKGRACDFAVEKGSFGGVATGEAKEYGTQLATWLVRNARSLGVMYVIWYKQIWTPGTGWHGYSSGMGDPSSDHTNHVHLSIY